MVGKRVLEGRGWTSWATVCLWLCFANNCGASPSVDNGMSVSIQGPGSDLGLEGCPESRGGSDLPATAVND